jgi:hypothetical protein
VVDFRPSAAADEVRRLAREGILAEEFRIAATDRRRYLREGAGEIAGPLLFHRMTRSLEHRRGHPRCASGLRGLAADCLDRYHDDLEAVLDHLFARATVPIDNLEGWLAVRLTRATVDGYRKRRGGRGAPQRPRLPKWLAEELAHDGRLLDLAVAMLGWAGNDATAGLSMWPLSAWAERRAAGTGGPAVTEASVARDVEIVLTAMRRRPTWYEKSVARPLGRKKAPVWFPARGSDGTHAEPQPFVVPRHEHDDALLRELAARALDLIVTRVEEGGKPAEVVAAVLRTVFGGVPASIDLDRAPDAGRTGPEQVVALIDEPARLDRIVATVVALMSGRPGSPIAESDGPRDRPSEP